jgi:hypothetical protein
MKHHLRAPAPGGISACLRGFSAIAAAAGLLVLAGCNDSTPPSSRVECTDEPGIICTWAGDGVAGFDGGGHALLESSFYWPADMTFGADGTPYIVDWNNHAIRKVTPEGILVTVIGTSIVGDGPLPGSTCTDLADPGCPGTEISLNHPTDMLPIPGSGGLMLLVCWHNHKLRTYNPNTEMVRVICGAGAGYNGDDIQATDALLNQPTQAVISSNGSIYVLDQRNQRIRMIDPDGVIHTVVGTGVAGYSGDGGSPLEAQLHFPAGSNPPTAGALAIDDQGRLYISDTLNERVRMVDFTADRITTVAGTGVAGYNGDDIPAVQAQLSNPRDLEIGPDGRLYIADEINNRIRAVDLDTGMITTVAGNGAADFSGDGGPATDPSLNRPEGIVFDPQGRLFIVDSYNGRIRRVTL